MLKVPPRHAIDAPAIFVTPLDPAWDFDRRDREIAEFLGGDSTQHPLDQYWLGETRFDLDAESTIGGETVTPRTYLRGKATEFRLRRIKTMDYARVHGWVENKQTRALAFDYCVRVGLVSVTNLDIPWSTKDDELSEMTMSALFDCGADERGAGHMLIKSIGSAIWMLSQPLSYAEKKA